MRLNELSYAPGAKKQRKRVGRGIGSGLGKTAGRGHKGCQARSGGGVRPLTEGGQMPIFRRLPKRGFSNFNFRREFETVNLCELERHFNDGDTVTLEALRDSRLYQQRSDRVKILAKGKLSKKLSVEAHAFSDKARQAIEAAGGTVKLIKLLDPAKAARQKRNTAKSRPAQPRVSRLEKKKARKAAAGADA